MHFPESLREWPSIIVTSKNSLARCRETMTLKMSLNERNCVFQRLTWLESRLKKRVDSGYLRKKHEITHWICLIFFLWKFVTVEIWFKMKILLFTVKVAVSYFIAYTQRPGSNIHIFLNYRFPYQDVWGQKKLKSCSSTSNVRTASQNKSKGLNIETYTLRRSWGNLRQVPVLYFLIFWNQLTFYGLPIYVTLHIWFFQKIYSQYIDYDVVGHCSIQVANSKWQTAITELKPVWEIFA